MPLIEAEGNLFTMGFSALGHGCNCTGVMGAGIAVEFRQRYPKMYEEYRQFCEEGAALPGDMFPYEAEDGTLILNLLTQPVPGPSATLEYVESAVRKAVEWCIDKGITELGIPRIGSGLGGLKWSLVRDRLEEVIADYRGFKLIVAVLSDAVKPHPDVVHLSAFKHPLLKVQDWGPSYDGTKMVAFHLNLEQDPDEADLISSRVILPPWEEGPREWHTVMLDLDVPAVLVPSTTPGHSHLYIDVPMDWPTYREVLAVLRKAKIIEPGYEAASVARKFTSLRLPWVPKVPPPGP